ncbi:hypothetical protein CK203_052398 [Vitis vinifera]|uniref:Retrotransposon gag domain-containing protein n=1 Tax=Vitis vinifera TaxID=29760 RepID=A0A438H673_VITVI|nr:hypothetical protein CK203_052398 [Vitis vinifera]
MNTSAGGNFVRLLMSELNPCMPYWIRDQEGRLVWIEIPRATELEIILEVMENQPEDQHSQHGQENDPNLYRSMRGRMHPLRMSGTILHHSSYKAIDYQATHRASASYFPWDGKDKAKIWLNSLRPRSIRTWTELQADFLRKFFPTHRTNGLKRQISNFSARENEKFYECWERYWRQCVGGDFMSKNPEEAYGFPKLCHRGFPWMG